ncbi:Mitochondrial import inner membrane translocase like protein [Argiope bruennichi]|uniref:Mitochondrial import inner membrane translocase like protein n=1 Tax=Argiope bruennichi TaxID=94029 RepID=A0A8T0EY19_ARGBR|nr:Mitochondrial import inner membrane translocase like protein [Argiope bruennichi]
MKNLHDLDTVLKFYLRPINRIQTQLNSTQLLVNKVFEWKKKYDESDNPVVRTSRLLTDKVTDLFGKN